MIQVINLEIQKHSQKKQVTLASLLGIEVRNFCLWTHDGTRLRKYWRLTNVEIW